MNHKFNMKSGLLFIALIFIVLVILIIDCTDKLWSFIKDCIMSKVHAKYECIDPYYYIDKRYVVMIKKHWWNAWIVVTDNLNYEEAISLVTQYKDRGYE